MPLGSGYPVLYRVQGLWPSLPGASDIQLALSPPSSSLLEVLMFSGLPRHRWGGRWEGARLGIKRPDSGFGYDLGKSLNCSEPLGMMPFAHRIVGKEVRQETED